MCPLRTCLPAALLAMLGASGSASAAEWWLEPVVHSQTFYDDNLRLQRETEQSVWSVLVEPRLAGGRRIQRAGIAFDAGAQFRRYPGDSELDSNDQDLHLNSHYLTERSRFGLDLDLVRDTTLTSELEETGFVQVRRRRTSRTLSPSWTYALGPRDTLQLSYRFNSVSYDAPLTEFVDYDYQTLAGTWIRSLDAKNRVHVTGTYSRYEASEIDATNDTVGIQAGLERRFSERTTATVLAGWRRTDAEFLQRQFVEILPGIGFFTQTPADAQSTGALFSAELEHKYPRAVFTANLSRSIDPGAAGSLYQRDQLRLNVRYRIDQRRVAGLGVHALRAESVEGASALRPDRTAYRFNPWYSWQVSRELRLKAEYLYRWQEYEGVAGSAASNRVALTLEYEWPRSSWSR